ncbi:MAG: stage III sporulation protein AG [Ruminococcaceae bacterium]|nr:stage III sporulation protein AG [Oscillospiraceae bacterium]
MKGLAGRIDVAAAWKKYRFAALIILLGIALMLMPVGNDKKESREEDKAEEVFSLEDTERRMEAILSRIEGAGKLQVMLTLKSGARLYLAEDTEESAEENAVQRRKETVIVSKGSGYEDVVVTQQIYPLYQGAVVVCQGGDKAAVRLAITEAVAALTGLSSDKISVVKWNS